MSEDWVEKAVEKMFKNYPKRGSASKFLRRQLRKIRIKKLFSHD